MKEEPMIHSEEFGELGRALLQAGRDARPPGHSQEKLLVALGVGLTSQLSAGTASAAAAKQSLLATKLAAAKWGLLAGGGLVAALVYVATQERPQVSAPEAQPASRVMEPPRLTSPAANQGNTHEEGSREPNGSRNAAEPVAQQSHASTKSATVGAGLERETAPHSGAKPQRPAAPRAPIVGATKPAEDQVSPRAPVAADDQRLAEEVRVLDRVRNAIRAGDLTRGKASLRAYRARFTNGALAPEAEQLATELARLEHASSAPEGRP